MSSSSSSSETQPPRVAIYHAFHRSFSSVTTECAAIASKGFSHIQTSPAHRFRTELPHDAPPDTPRDVWWLAYQPVQYSVGNLYGSESDLTALCVEAHRVGLKVIVDVCLNFMASLQGFEGPQWDEAERNGSSRRLWDLLDRAYPPFRKEDFLPRYPSRGGGKQKGSRSSWFNRAMPALDYASSRVQKVHFEFLQRLLDCGVDSFRVDAALYMPPEVVRVYAARFPNAWTYLEIFEKRSDERIRPYLEWSIEDFRPTMALIDALSNADCVAPSRGKKGMADLKGLDQRIRNGDVVFSMNHDTFVNSTDRQHGIGGMLFKSRFTETCAASIADAVLLALSNGFPIVLDVLSNSRPVLEGLSFRRAMIERNAPLSSHPLSVEGGSLDASVLWIERGTHGFAVVNGSAKLVTIKRLTGSLLNGLTLDSCYVSGTNRIRVQVDLKDGSVWVLTKLGLRSAKPGLRIATGSALFFVTVSDACLSTETKTLKFFN